MGRGRCKCFVPKHTIWVLSVLRTTKHQLCLAGAFPSGLSQATRSGFAVRESCAHPLTHLPAKTENTRRVFRSVCGRLVALAANYIASNLRTQRREICCQQISYQGKLPLTPISRQIRLLTNGTKKVLKSSGAQ